MSEHLLSYWEPGAPSFEERYACLRYAFGQGYATSVSAEPLIEAAKVRELATALLPWVTDSLWIGKMNHIKSRVTADARAIDAIKAGQTDARVREIYESLRDEPKVRWKESYKSVLGLAMPKSAGLDI